MKLVYKIQKMGKTEVKLLSKSKSVNECHMTVVDMGIHSEHTSKDILYLF